MEVGWSWVAGQTCPCVDRMSVSTAESSHLHSAALWNRTEESGGMLELEPSFQGFLGFPASAKNSPLDDYHLLYRAFTSEIVSTDQGGVLYLTIVSGVLIGQNSIISWSPSCLNRRPPKDESLQKVTFSGRVQTFCHPLVCI